MQCVFYVGRVETHPLFQFVGKYVLYWKRDIMMFACDVETHYDVTFIFKVGGKFMVCFKPLYAWWLVAIFSHHSKQTKMKQKPKAPSMPTAKKSANLLAETLPFKKVFQSTILDTLIQHFLHWELGGAIIWFRIFFRRAVLFLGVTNHCCKDAIKALNSALVC